MASQICVAVLHNYRGGGGGACMAGGMRGGWVCMAGGHVWWGVCMVGVCVAGETATAADGTLLECILVIHKCDFLKKSGLRHEVV